MLVVAIVATTSNTYAQYASDALRFSQTNYGSTARFKAMGNAQIANGGDLSSLGGNPAGLGLFTKSEFGFTPEFNQSGANANFLGQNTNTNKSQLNINQIGAVFFAPTYRQKGESTSKGLISGVFGLSYNRTNDYGSEVNYSGVNGSTSITDYFAQIAGSTTPNNLAQGSLERMAYDNYLISFDNGAGNYFSETYVDQTQNQFNRQRNNQVKSGSVSEFNFSAAANISNQFYIGASIGLVDLKYNSDSQFEESGSARELATDGTPTGNTINYKLLYNQNQVTKGSGVNGRLGVIFKPVEGLRLGATFQTPTWFVIDDSYTEGLDNRGTNKGTSDKQTYDFSYNLRTPLKGSLGASYVIAGQALISADVDFVDYSSIRFSTQGNGGVGDSQIMIDNNAAVRSNYKSAINYRVGGEYKLNNLSLRAGYGVNGSPYKDDDDKVFDTKMYSGGLGYRVSNYYVDLTYQRVETNNDLSTYVLNNGKEPVAQIKDTRNNVFLTLGLRF